MYPESIDSFSLRLKTDSLSILFKEMGREFHAFMTVYAKVYGDRDSSFEME